MFAVIYKFKLDQSQEDLYKKHWHKLASYFIANYGALGSCLHKGEDGLWVAYSRWPSKQMRDAIWFKNDLTGLPQNIQEALTQINIIKQENIVLGTHEETCLEVVDDLL